MGPGTQGQRAWTDSLSCSKVSAPPYPFRNLLLPLKNLHRSPSPPPSSCLSGRSPSPHLSSSHCLPLFVSHCVRLCLVPPSHLPLSPLFTLPCIAPETTGTSRTPMFFLLCPLSELPCSFLFHFPHCSVFCSRRGSCHSQNRRSADCGYRRITSSGPTTCSSESELPMPLAYGGRTSGNNPRFPFVFTDVLAAPHFLLFLYAALLGHFQLWSP